MREYLFRGKRTDNGEWVTGRLLADDVIVPSGQPFSMVEGIFSEYSVAHLAMHEVDQNTVGQYTGIVDRNGNKVFEGDILHIYKNMSGMGDYYYPPLEYPVPVVVRWDLCAWCWETFTEENKYYIHFPDAWCHYECEVIGNEFDNPELMKEVK